METSELLTLLLGGGAVATVGAFFSGVKNLQTGARAREKETVTELVRQRKEAWAEREYADDLVVYWRNWAGVVEYHAHQNGVNLPSRPKEPAKPEEKTDD